MRSNAALRFLLTIFAVQLFFSNHYLDGDMANSILGLSAAIVEEGRLQTDTYYRASIDVASRDGHYYSGHAPGLSLAAVPLYAAAGLTFEWLLPDIEAQLDRQVQASESLQYAGKPSVRLTPHPARFMLAHWLLNTLTSLVTLATGWLLFDTARRWTGATRRALLLPLALVFGTTFFYWGSFVSSQPVATALIFWAFYLLEVARRPASASHRALLAGLALGVACATDYAAAFGAAILFGMALVLRRYRRAAFIALGAIPPLAATGLYHYLAFGSPLATPYAFRAFHTIQSNPTLGLELPGLSRLFRLAFGPGEGIFTTMPVLLLGLVGLAYMAREPARRVYVVLSGSMFAAYAAYSAFIPFDTSTGGFGPRYFLPAVPFILLGLATVPLSPPRSFRWWAAGVLAAASVLANLLAVFYGRRLFEEGLASLVTRLGLSSYTLRTLNEYGLLSNPLITSAVVAVVLAAAAINLWLHGRQLAGEASLTL
jgi:hypothetical protein